MKIIITVNTYYPLTDGVQAVTGYLAEGLASRGHEVIVVTTSQTNTLNEEKHNGVRILRWDIHTIHALHRGDKRGYRQLILNLCSDADVLLNVCTQTATTEVLFPILNQIQCKKVLYMHGMHSFRWNSLDLSSPSSIAHKCWNNLRWGLDYLINGKFLKQYDAVIQLHELDSATKFFKKHYGIDSEIIENAADPVFFDGSYFKKNEQPYAINVSNFDVRKNQEFILKAFYLSKLQKEDLGLLLIGSRENEYLARLRQLKKDLDNKFGYRRVRFLTNVPREKIADYVKGASLYLVGSKWEAFPISIIEGMAAGKTFISTNVGIVRYLPGGIITDTPAEMGYWISKLLKNESVLQKIGSAGQKYAQDNLTTEIKIRQLEKILEK